MIACRVDNVTYLGTASISDHGGHTWMARKAVFEDAASETRVSDRADAGAPYPILVREPFVVHGLSTLPPPPSGRDVRRLRSDDVSGL